MVLASSSPGETNLMSVTHIKVWPYEKAPANIKTHVDPDDCDWVALVPKSLRDKYIGWLECTHFGCCSIDKCVLEDGSVIYSGYHS